MVILWWMLMKWVVYIFPDYPTFQNDIQNPAHMSRPNQNVSSDLSRIREKKSNWVSHVDTRAPQDLLIIFSEYFITSLRHCIFIFLSENDGKYEINRVLGSVRSQNGQNCGYMSECAHQPGSQKKKLFFDSVKSQARMLKCFVFLSTAWKFWSTLKK